MRLIKPSFTIIEQPNGIEGIYKQIELAGRTCYKSEEKITEDSAKGFVDRMVKSGHGAMLEHGTVYLHFPIRGTHYQKFIKYCTNPYTKVGNNENTADLGFFATTNYRILVENGWLDDLQYICEPTEFHEKRYTVKFILPIGISREFCRHRVMSFAEQSTRYCNFSKDQYANEVTFIEPFWLNSHKKINSEAFDNVYEIYCSACEEAEGYYFLLIENGFKPQAAREMLPLGTKSELIMTGFVSDWRHFFDLRCSTAAHPQASELAIPLYKEFINKGYLK